MEKNNKPPIIINVCRFQEAEMGIDPEECLKNVGGDCWVMGALCDTQLYVRVPDITEEEARAAHRSVC